MKTIISKKLTYSLGTLLLGVLMVVNIQVATTSKNIEDINLLSLEASIFTPAAVATFYGCTSGNGSCLTSGTQPCGRSKDCTVKWVCGTGCSCSFDWVKYSGTPSTAKCKW